MSNRRIKVSKLIKRDGAGCHYCGVWLNRASATLDHVIPSSLGGWNGLDNYVLACFECNQLRGNDLNWCDCEFCGPLIEEYIKSDKHFWIQFAGIVKFNRPRIYFRTGVWKVYLHNNQHHFKTWSEALHFANTYKRSLK